jgi:hypothetical protein
MTHKRLREKFKQVGLSILYKLFDNGRGKHGKETKI